MSLANSALDTSGTLFPSIGTILSFSRKSSTYCAFHALPSLLLLAEVYEAVVAVNVDEDAVQGETVGDCRLHLADRRDLGDIDVGEGAALAVYDEATSRHALSGSVDQFLDR